MLAFNMSRPISPLYGVARALAQKRTFGLAFARCSLET